MAKEPVMNGAVVHFEVPYDDADRARAFYSDVFGWNIQPMPELDYNFVSTGATSAEGMPTEPGYIGGGLFQRQGDVDRPVITINVENIDAALAKLEEHGGTQVGEQIPVGEMGIAAYFKDSEGNLMGLWQTKS
jgi:predicted enzyme related to lactoylglutathione lyase